MPTIRPNLPPPAPAAAPKPANAARLAAQKAFFQIAANAPAQGAAPVQASATAAVPRASAPVTRSTEPPAETPAKPLRPGSLLDIRV